MAVTAYDQSRLSSAQTAALQQYTNAWNTANASGDQAGMDKAHAGAEAIRNAAGYTSNDDGTYAGEYSAVADQILPDYSAILDQVQSIVKQNNATAQANTQAQWEYNKEEAQKNRDWQEYMANTAHQREVEDLKAAGLNPVLSATGGSGAATTSGATASGSAATNDTSANSILGNYINSLINSATAINQANINAKSAANVASLETAMQYKIAAEFPTTNKVLGGLLNGIISGLGGGSSAKSTGENIINNIKDYLKEDNLKNNDPDYVGTKDWYNNNAYKYLY